MTLTAALPWLFAIVGLVIYFTASKAELKECGRITFAFGLLVGLLQSPASRTLLKF